MQRVTFPTGETHVFSSGSPPKFHNHSFKTESLDPKMATEITERLANEITEITKITESRSSCLVISVSTYWPISPA